MDELDGKDDVGLVMTETVEVVLANKRPRNNIQHRFKSIYLSIYLLLITLTYLYELNCDDAIHVNQSSS